MADKKVSQLPSLTTLSSDDLLLVVDAPNSVPVSKNISVKNLFGTISVNTSISGRFALTANASIVGTVLINGAVNANTSLTARNLTVSSNGVVIQNQLTPANSSVSTITTGKIFFDANYLYIKVANSTIKRVALSTF